MTFLGHPLVLTIHTQFNVALLIFLFIVLEVSVRWKPRPVSVRKRGLERPLVGLARVIMSPA